MEVNDVMTVMAKFRLDEQINRAQGGKVDGKTPISVDYVFRVVQDGSPENKLFWKWTPSGEIRLNTINPEVLKQFEIGQEFYIDITPA